MWNKKRARTDLQRFAGKTSLLAVGAQLQGDLSFQGAVQVDGVLKGNLLTTEGMVRVSEQGKVEGEVRAPHIIIDGEVLGDVHASTHLELGARARIRGNLYYAVMEMAMGAQVEGRLCHLQEQPRPLELPQSLSTPE